MAHFYSPAAIEAVEGFDQFARSTALIEDIEMMFNIRPSVAEQPRCTLDLILYWMKAAPETVKRLEIALDLDKEPGSRPFYRWCGTHALFQQTAMIISDAWRRGAFNGTLLERMFPNITETFLSDPEVSTKRTRAEVERNGFDFLFKTPLRPVSELLAAIDYEHPVLAQDTYEHYRAKGEEHRRTTEW